jgi:hypothetical protein
MHIRFHAALRLETAGAPAPSSDVIRGKGLGIVDSAGKVERRPSFNRLFAELGVAA